LIDIRQFFVISEIDHKVCEAENGEEDVQPEVLILSCEDEFDSGSDNGYLDDVFDTDVLGLKVEEEDAEGFYQDDNEGYIVNNIVGLQTYHQKEEIIYLQGGEESEYDKSCKKKETDHQRNGLGDQLGELMFQI